MRKLGRALNSGWFVVPVFLIYGVLGLAPGWIWLNPRSVIISDAVQGQAPTVTVDRAINFSFHGSYTVDVWKVSNNEHKDGLIACGQGGAHRYKGGLDGTFTTDLVDWAGNDKRCKRLKPGMYIVETCWTILSPLWGLLPSKRVCAKPDDFQITRVTE